MTHTQVTAPTEFIEANGIRFTYRRFGKEDEVPQFVHAFAAHPRCAVDHLSRFGPRITISVPGLVPVACTYVSGWIARYI